MIPHIQSSPVSPWPFDPDAPGFDQSAASLFADGYASLGPSVPEGVRVTVGEIHVDRLAGTLSAVVSVDGWDAASPETAVAELGQSDYAVARFGFGALVVDREAALSSGDVSSATLYMSPAAVGTEPDRVRGIVLVNPDEDGEPDWDSNSGIVSGREIVVPSGPVKIKAGYNIELGDEGSLSNSMFGISSSVVPTWRSSGASCLSIAAVPGAGAGRVPVDESECDCGASGNLFSDAFGDIVLETDGCYQVVQVDGSSLKIVGKCTACCQCDDYVEIGRRLGEQSVVLGDVKELLTSDSATYNDAVERHNESLSDVGPGDFIAKASVMAQPAGIPGVAGVALSGDGVKGSLGRAQGAVSLKNLSAVSASVNVNVSMGKHKVRLVQYTIPNPAYHSSVSTQTVRKRNSGSGGLSVSIPMPPGSSVTLRAYGVQESGEKQSGSASISGVATFVTSKGSFSKSFIAKCV